MKIAQEYADQPFGSKSGSSEMCGITFSSSKTTAQSGHLGNCMPVNSGASEGDLCCPLWIIRAGATSRFRTQSL